jgi:2-hydroxy-3-keto-5-methylthiopentenyl-1-phosphate phosphatase
MQTAQTIIFIDFDGTFSEKDIGHKLFTHFSNGVNLQFVEKWKNGTLSTRDCMLEEASLLEIDEPELYRFLDQFKLRAGANELYHYAKLSGIPFYIVSDGSDIYIKYILKKYNLEEIRYFANRAEIINSRYILDFPYDNGGCIRCGCCKGVRIKEITGDKRNARRIIFIGDGLSDICALPHADIIFARGDLLKYCRLENIKACEYGDFFDILDWLKNHEKSSGKHPG